MDAASLSPHIPGELKCALLCSCLSMLTGGRNLANKKIYCTGRNLIYKLWQMDRSHTITKKTQVEKDWKITQMTTELWLKLKCTAKGKKQWIRWTPVFIPPQQVWVGMDVYLRRLRNNLRFKIILKHSIFFVFYFHSVDFKYLFFLFPGFIEWLFDTLTSNDGCNSTMLFYFRQQ